MIYTVLGGIGVWLAIAATFALLASAAHRRLGPRGAWITAATATVVLTVTGTRNIHAGGLHNDVLPLPSQPYELMRDAIGPFALATISCTLATLVLRRRLATEGASRRCTFVVTTLAFLAGPLIVLLIIAIADIGPALLP